MWEQCDAYSCGGFSDTLLEGADEPTVDAAGVLMQIVV